MPCFRVILDAQTHKYMHTTHSSVAITSIAAIAAASFLAFVGIVSAQEVGDLDVLASGKTAIAEFTLPTPCTAYTIEWGDASEEMIETAGDICAQVLEEVALAHTYEEAGEYTVTLAFSGETETETVQVEESDLSFGIDDVASITEQWIDPSPIMADEEYSIYTIELDSGETVKVKAGGFTLPEWRNEQFENAGYTGDVDALLAMIEKDDTADEPPQQDSDNQTSLYQQYIQALKDLLAQLQALLQLRQS